MVFSRTLRPRVRRLPRPPNLDSLEKSKKQTTQITTDTIFIDDENLKRFSTNTKNLEQTESALEQAEHKILENLESAMIEKKSVLTEIGEILKEGPITENLMKIVPEPVHGVDHDVDYTQIRQSQYQRAIDDYLAAGKTFSDSGLYSNASISYTCAVLARLLATSSIQEAYQEFQDIVEMIQDKQIIKSSVFSLLTHLFESLAKKDKKGVKRQLEKLKLIETFSIDDQELINDSVKLLSSLGTKSEKLD